MCVRRLVTTLVHAFVGWALCFATMGIGMATTSLENALIVHAIGAPVYFSIVSLSYFRRCGDANPLRTATVFVGFAMVVDFFLVALVIQRSLDMFASALGTWIPLALIFSSAYLTGLYATRDSAPAGSHPASRRAD